MRRRSLELRSPLPPEQVAQLLDLRGISASGEAGLSARLDGGRVTAMVPSRGEYHARAVLRGHLVRDPRGSVLTGTVRESPLLAFFQWLMLVPGALLLIALVDVLSDDPVDPAGVAVCGLGGAVLVTIGLLLRWQRDGTFQVGHDELEQALRRRLGQTGR
jgi:hypothetical protein